jgi:hypothetical protein
MPLPARKKPAESLVMSPLQKLGHTPYSAGREGILGVSFNTAVRWGMLDGKYPIPKTVAKLLRALVKLGSTEV